MSMLMPASRLLRRGLRLGLAPTHHRRRAPVLAATRGDHSHSHHHHREGPPDVTIKWVFKKSGEAIETPAYFGENLLRLAQRHDIPLEGACEGVMACSTCHCILEDDFFDELEEELEEDEEDMLDQAFGLTPTSRLGCQLKVAERFCTSPVEVLPDAQPLVQVEAVEKANPLNRQRCAHATLVDVATKAQAAARYVCAEALRRRGDGPVLQEG